MTTALAPRPSTLLGPGVDPEDTFELLDGLAFGLTPSARALEPVFADVGGHAAALIEWVGPVDVARDGILVATRYVLFRTREAARPEQARHRLPLVGLRVPFHYAPGIELDEDTLPLWDRISHFATAVNMAVRPIWSAPA